VLDRPLAEMSALSKAGAVAEAYLLTGASLPLRLLPRKRLTDAYLRDPALRRGEEQPIRLVR
jgi:hypothetical protein